MSFRLPKILIAGGPEAFAQTDGAGWGEKGNEWSAVFGTGNGVEGDGNGGLAVVAPDLVEEESSGKNKEAQNEREAKGDVIDVRKDGSGDGKEEQVEYQAETAIVRLGKDVNELKMDEATRVVTPSTQDTQSDAMGEEESKEVEEFKLNAKAQPTAAASEVAEDLPSGIEESMLEARKVGNEDNPLLLVDVGSIKENSAEGEGDEMSLAAGQATVLFNSGEEKSSDDESFGFEGLGCPAAREFRTQMAWARTHAIGTDDEILRAGAHRHSTDVVVAPEEQRDGSGEYGNTSTFVADSTARVLSSAMESAVVRHDPQGMLGTRRNEGCSLFFFF